MVCRWYKRINNPFLAGPKVNGPYKTHQEMQLKTDAKVFCLKTPEVVITNQCHSIVGLLTQIIFSIQTSSKVKLSLWTDIWFDLIKLYPLISLKSFLTWYILLKGLKNRVKRTVHGFVKFPRKRQGHNEHQNPIMN